MISKPYDKMKMLQIRKPTFSFVERSSGQQRLLENSQNVCVPFQVIVSTNQILTGAVQQNHKYIPKNNTCIFPWYKI